MIPIKKSEKLTVRNITGFNLVTPFPLKLPKYLLSYTANLLIYLPKFLDLDTSMSAANPMAKDISVHTAELYLEHSHLHIIDGDMGLDSGWLWGGFGVGGHLIHDVSW